MDYSKLIVPGISAAAVLGGNAMQARSANKSSEWQRQMAEAEMRRRNMLQGMAAPTLLRGLGYRNPADIQRMTQQIGSPMTGGSSAPVQSGGGGSTLGKVASGVSQGVGALGTASSLGLLGGAAAPTAASLGLAAGAPLAAGSTAGALGLGTANAGMMLGGGASTAAGSGGLLGTLGGLASNPFTIAGAGILGAGLLAKHYIGQGRKQADKATGDGGYEGQFRNTLTDMSAHGGDVSALEQAYQQYMNAIEAERRMGGNHAKVANQSMSNQPLQQTYATLHRQLGGV